MGFAGGVIKAISGGDEWAGMSLRTLSAALTVIVIGASVALGGSPARAASLVDLVVRAVDADGEPVPYVPFLLESSDGTESRTSWVETGEDGTVQTGVVPDATAVATLIESAMTDESGTELLVTGGQLVSAGGEAYRPSMATGSGGATLDVRMPRLVERAVRVVTADGQPVAGAQVTPLGLVSEEVTDTGGSYRVVVRAQEGIGTDTAGFARFTAWAQEPDPSVASAVVGHQWDRNGQPAGGVVRYNATVSGELSQWMPYSVLVDAGSEVVVPDAPRFVSVTVARGLVPGQATLAATLVQTDADGQSVPVGAEVVELWSEPADADAERLAVEVSKTNGRVAFRFTIAGPTQVFLHLRTGSHVPASMIAQPLLGDALAATVTALRVGGRATLPRVTRGGVAATWRSATPQICSIAAPATVRAIRVGACSLTATTRGNATYGALSVRRAISVRA